MDGEVALGETGAEVPVQGNVDADFNPAALIAEKTKLIQRLQQQYRYLQSAFSETCDRLPLNSPLSLSPPSKSPRNSVTQSSDGARAEMTSEATFSDR